MKRYRTYYTTYFRDGAMITTWGTCGGDAGGRALRMRDAERGDRLAVVEKVQFSFEVEV